MRNRTRMITAVVAATAAVTSASTVAAVASTTGGKPGATAGTVSASAKPGGTKAAKLAEEQPGHDALAAAVAGALHVAAPRVSAALQPLFAAGRADTTSAAFAAAARSLGVSTQQLAAALESGKQSLAGSAPAQPGQGGAKTAGSKRAEEQQGHDAMAAAVARALHVSTARVSAALRPIFVAGYSDPSSPAFAAAARALGVSTSQLNAALAGAKQSLAAAG